jgi:hypothetical protein
MATTRVSRVGFLNEKDHASSVARLGAAALPSGVSPQAVVTLARLTCQAHDIHMSGLRSDYDEDDLLELQSVKLIHWTGGDTVNLV